MIPVLPIAAVLLLAAAPVSPVEQIAYLGPAKVGADSAGSFWAWNRETGAVLRYAADGRILGETRVRDARSIDAEPWGVAAVSTYGDRLSILPWDGGTARIVPLDHPVHDVAWLDARTVAVSPLTSDRRIEIWDVEKPARVRAFGEEPAVRTGPGATRLRTALLEFRASDGLLYSLEAFTGDLQVHTRDGGLAWRAQVTHPRRRELEAWLEEVDAQAKAAGDVQTPAVLNWSQFAVAPDGAAWLVQECPQDGPVQLLAVLPRGVAQPKALPPQPCCTSSVAAWGGELIFYRGRQHPKGACAAARRFLSDPHQADLLV